ncbi:glycoprotein precursor, partial [Aphalara polygoni bunya-like virus]
MTQVTMSRILLTLCVYIAPAYCQYSEANCKPVAYDLSSIVTPALCPDMAPEWNSQTGTINDCFGRGGFISDYDCTSADGTIKRITCMREINCGAGLYLNGSGHCTHGTQECYHYPTDIVPKIVILPGSTCGDADWKSIEPNFCSMVHTAPGCSSIGRSVMLNYVTLGENLKRYVTRLSIEMAQIKTKANAYYTDLRIPRLTKITGTSDYCKYIEPEDENCHSRVSTPETEYRIFDQSSLIPFVHINTCRSPVFGFGMEKVMVFDKEETTMRTVCHNCRAECDDGQLTLTIPEPGDKIIRYCARSACRMVETFEQLIAIKRTFQSKIADTSVVITAYDMAKSYNYDLEATCKPVGVCKAIDCSLCWLRFINVSCYEAYHYMLVLGMLYLILMIIATFVGLAAPIVKAFFKITMIIFKLVWKVSRSLARISGKSVDKVTKFAEDDDRVELLPMTRNVESRKSPKTSKRDYKSMFMVIFFLTILIQASAQKTCSVTQVENMRGEMCKKVGNNLECQQSSIVSVPMISYDQQSCLYFLGPKTDIIGTIHITPIELSFQCTKVHEFWTRDVTFTSEHIVHCPHAADCTTEWCPTVNHKTRVIGFSDITGP